MSKIIVENGKFTNGSEGMTETIFVEGSELEVGQCFALPGFIDVHCHGAGGIDVNTADAKGLLEIGKFLATCGVTGWLPTLVPDSEGAYQRVVAAIDEAMALQNGTTSARILGIHYEGVFANEHMCGALHKEHFRQFTDQVKLESLPLPQAGVKMMTFAPEINGGIELAGALTEDGWITSIGHTSASPEILDSAYEAGAKHMTHFFNAMTGIHHRETGVAGWGLIKDGTTFDIIADGIHVNREMLQLAVQTKGIENVLLISDSIAPTGLGDGEFSVWGEEIIVANRRTRNSHGSIAGSVITMLDAVRVMKSIGFSLEEISNMASLNPAKLLGLDGEIGSIETGKKANMVLLDDEMKVVNVLIDGRGIVNSE